MSEVSPENARMPWIGPAAQNNELGHGTFEQQRQLQMSRCLLVLEMERIAPRIRSIMAEMTVLAIARGNIRAHEPAFTVHPAYILRHGLKYLCFSYDETGRPVEPNAGTVYAAPILQPVPSSQGIVSAGWAPSEALEFAIELPERRPLLEDALDRLESRGVL